MCFVLVLLVAGFTASYYSFVLHAVRVPTPAMANTILPGDYVLVKKRFFGELARGDIIVFAYPKDTSVKYLFRVVGLPGETIQVRGILIYIDGQELAEERVIVKPDDSLAESLSELSTEGSGPYRVYYSSRAKDDEAGRASDTEADTFGVKAPFRIPDNEYFVMGDNRDNSYDSRFWGTVPRSLVFGKASMIYFSVSRDKQGNESIRWSRVFTRLRLH